MALALLIGFTLGFVLAIPPGPIGVMVIKMGVENTMRSSIKLSIGTAMMDAVYSFVAILAASAANAAIGSFMDTNPILYLVFQVGVILALLAYGIINLLRARKKTPEERDILNAEPRRTRSKFIENLKTKGPFLLGVGLALTNLAHPTFMPTLAIVSAQVHKFGLFDISLVNNLGFAIGFGFGNFVWLYVLTRIINHYKNRFTSNAMVRLRQFAGITFISAGGLIGYRVLTLTHWAEVLRVVLAF